MFATALAFAAPEALLVDVDPWGGGIDLALGGEADAGLRWPDLAVQGGRLDYAALRDALPARDGVTVLSAGRAAATWTRWPSVRWWTRAGAQAPRSSVTCLDEAPRRSMPRWTPPIW